MSYNIDDLLEEIEILKGYKHMHQKINEQNKRYRELLSQMNYARRELSGEEFIDICCDNLIDFEALEGESSETD